jgi:hypothetical protein
MVEIPNTSSEQIDLEDTLNKNSDHRADEAKRLMARTIILSVK